MGEDDRTRIMTARQKASTTETMSDDGKTKIVRGPAIERTQVEQASTRVHTTGSDNADSPSATNDPVVGWLVVVSGPGRGNSRQIHYGMNSVGRSSDERIALDFGDESISRESHAYIVYDNKQSEFYIQHGGKSNLVRLNDKPVMTPESLSHGDKIEIGDTKLMFVPLCNADFNWETLDG